MGLTKLSAVALLPGASVAPVKPDGRAALRRRLTCLFVGLFLACENAFYLSVRSSVGALSAFFPSYSYRNCLSLSWFDSVINGDTSKTRWRGKVDAGLLKALWERGIKQSLSFPSTPFLPPAEASRDVKKLFLSFVVSV